MGKVGKVVTIKILQNVQNSLITYIKNNIVTFSQQPRLYLSNVSIEFFFNSKDKIQ